MKQFFLIPAAVVSALLMVSCRSGKNAPAPAPEQKPAAAAAPAAESTAAVSSAAETAPAPAPEPSVEARLRQTYGWNGGAVMPDGVIGYRAPVDDAAVQKKSPESMETYVVVKGDTLWGIAKKKYGDGRKWEKILEANNAVLRGNTELKIGTRLLIPVPAK